ncbi:MAG TPA: hypothetical protein VIA18_17705, partial [Polyangia bacterium]|nr:hypothetical protein [Polyangia bacterium]
DMAVGAGHDPTTATPIMIDGPSTSATLIDAQTSDWYTFNGTAGDRIVITAQATQLQTENTGFDPAVTSTTLLLTGADMNVQAPLTYQAGQWPSFAQDAVLYVVLPATGAYYLGVQDCNALFSSGCSSTPAQVTHFDYQLFVEHTSKLSPPEVVASATNVGTTATADPLVYKVATGTEYDSDLLGGAFPAAAATQVFSFMPPAAATPATGARGRAEFYVQPIGSFQGGDLSDANIKIWATDSTGTTIISSADQNNYPTSNTAYTPMQFSLPYTPGSQYYLFVQNTQTGGTPAKDFYFIDHFLNPLIDVAETEVFGAHTDDTSATAQTLAGQGSAKTLFAIDGDISAPATAGTPDLDWFALTVPASTTQYAYQCDAARTGSGLGGFKLQLFEADGTTSVSTMTESATTDISTPTYTNLPAASPAGSKLYLELTAATQDATVTGTQYRCFVFFQ